MGFSCIYKVILYMISSILLNFIYCLSVDTMNISIELHTTLHLQHYSKYLFTTLYNREYPIIIHSKSFKLNMLLKCLFDKSITTFYDHIYLHNNNVYDYVARKRVVAYSWTLLLLIWMNEFWFIRRIQNSNVSYACFVCAVHINKLDNSLYDPLDSQSIDLNVQHV